MRWRWDFFSPDMKIYASEDSVWKKACIVQRSKQPKEYFWLREIVCIWTFGHALSLVQWRNRKKQNLRCHSNESIKNSNFFSLNYHIFFFQADQRLCLRIGWWLFGGWNCIFIPRNCLHLLLLEEKQMTGSFNYFQVYFSPLSTASDPPEDHKQY